MTTDRPHNRRIETDSKGETYTFWDCPECGEPICTWTDCPSCGWYEVAAWNRALRAAEAGEEPPGGAA